MGRHSVKGWGGVCVPSGCAQEAVLTILIGKGSTMITSYQVNLIDHSVPGQTDLKGPSKAHLQKQAKQMRKLNSAGYVA